MNRIEKNRKAMRLLKSNMTDEQYKEFKALISDLDLTIKDVTKLEEADSQDSFTPKYIY